MTPRRRAEAIGLLAGADELDALAGAIGVVLACRAGRAASALVCLHGAQRLRREAAETAPDPGAGARRRRPQTGIGGALEAAGIEARRRGRVIMVELPQAGADAVAVATEVLALAGPAPTLVALDARQEVLDGLLVAQDAVLVCAPADGDPALTALALESLARTALVAAKLDARLGPLGRVAARNGLWAPVAVHRRLAEVLG